MTKFLTLVSSIILICTPLMAKAEYPEKPLRLIVPFTPGGNIDATARNVSPALSEALGKPVIVENRAGAGGSIGAQLVAKSAPDGYVMLLGSTGALAAAKALQPNLPFDPLKDFAAASTISRTPLVMVIHPSIPAKNVAEFIALAKANPGKYSFASTGNGTSNHLTGELFQRISGTKLLHVPYKGSGQALTDLLGGQVDVMFDQLSSSLAYIKAGKLRGLGVTTRARAAAMPDMPTLAESGLAGFEASTTTGVMFPAGTPPAIVKKVNAAMTKVLKLPATRDSFVQLGADVQVSTPEEFDRIMREETSKWSKVVRDANVKIE
jgi:tripartite-type tricarboxylate transporter receptor subunit TctC